MSAVKHVPAWKRLGLKLKYAKDEAGGDQRQPESDLIASVNNGDQTVDAKKRPRDEMNDVSEPKKRKVSQESPNTYSDPEYEPLEKDATSRFVDSVYKGRTSSTVTKAPQRITFDDDEPEQPTKTKPSKPVRKKSVTFSPDTKSGDGESAQNFSKAWLLPQSAQSAESVINVPQTFPEPEIDTPTKPSSGLTAPTNTPRTDETDATTPTEQRACVAYLEQFHSDKTKWKFNKSKQNDLLKHIWDMTQLPWTFNPALVSYISGLQGANARQRLIDSAQEILEPLLEARTPGLLASSRTYGARKAVYHAAVKEQVSELKSELKAGDVTDRQSFALRLSQAERQTRADELLREALWKDIPDDDIVPITNDGTNGGADKSDAVKGDAANITAAKDAVVKGDAAKTDETGIDGGVDSAKSKRRLRKTRTASPEVESSSESSSDESSEESDSSDED